MNARTYKKAQLIRDLNQQLDQIRNHLETKQEHLPTIHKTKHPLFHSLFKSPKQKLTLSPTLSHHHNQHLYSQQLKNNNAQQKISNICNISLQSVDQHTPPRSNSKIHLNSTWRRMVINSKWSSIENSASTRYEETSKASQKKSQQTIDVYERKINNDMFTPRMTKMDLTKRNSDVLQKYLNRFNSGTKTEEEAKKFLNITHLRQLTDRSHFEQLQRLKLTLENRKLQECEKKFNHLKNKINLNPEKGIKKKLKLKKNKDKDKNKNKVPFKNVSHAQMSFEPWQQEIHEDQELYM